MKYPSTVSDQQVDIPVLLLINRGFHVDPSIYYYLIMFCFEKTAVIESIFVFNLKQYFMFLVSFLYFFRILKTFVCNTILDYKTILKIDVWGLRIKYVWGDLALNVESGFIKLVLRRSPSFTCQTTNIMNSCQNDSTIS